MREVRTGTELLGDPIGTTLRGASFVAWVHSPSLIGLFHVGALVHKDQAKLAEIFSLPTSPALARRYDLLHDISAVSHFDELAFDFMEKFLAAFVDAIAPRVRRLAVVRPRGIAGAAFTGLFHEWVVPRFDARLCTTRSEAYDFLAVPRAARGELDALSDGRDTPALRGLRDQLLRDPMAATLKRAAAALAMSARSLQRLLREHDTSFRSELASARIRAAEVILLECDDKLEAVARRLGFSSAASFVRMFERATGEPPGAFRERLRGAVPRSALGARVPRRGRGRSPG